MQDHHSPPTTTAIALACALIAGVTGYFLGQAKSIGLFNGRPNSQRSRRKGKDADESEESSDEEDEVGEINDFKDHTEECKLVLVVRTDLGMTKGMFFFLLSAPQLSNLWYRQDWSSVWSRNPRLLQSLPPQCTQFSHTYTLGTVWTDESRCAGQKRGRATDATGAGIEPRISSAGYT